MQACGKVSGTVEPLAFSVPESLAALLLLAFGALLDPPLPLPDEEQAASTATAARATPAVAVFWMRTRCILKEPLFSYPGLRGHNCRPYLCHARLGESDCSPGAPVCAGLSP